MKWLVRVFTPRDRWRIETTVLITVLMTGTLGAQTVLALWILWSLCRLSWRGLKYYKHYRREKEEKARYKAFQVSPNDTASNELPIDFQAFQGPLT